LSGVSIGFSLSLVMGPGELVGPSSQVGVRSVAWRL
jgi:hypothetical protein